MGIVLKQSFKNTLIIFLGFAIGGINVLFLYTHFLHQDYYGLITFLLSSANILLPLMMFGMHLTIIKFYSSYNTKIEKDQFLTSAILFPLLIIVPIAVVGSLTYNTISDWISSENQIIKHYTSMIFIIAIFMGYFEVFYALSKVQFQSVFGNFIKEIFSRICTTFLLLAVFLKWIDDVQFIYAIVIVYGIRMLIMLVYAFLLYRPKFIFKLPNNYKEIISFSFYIIVAGSAGGILLEIDKFMIPQLEKIAEVAYYAVGIYIASVVGIPSRAMQQIINPLTAKELNNENMAEVSNLYKKSSITLLVAGGLLFLLINLNVTDLYLFINKPEYSVGIIIVLMISFSELFKLALGTNGAILSNSKYYKIFFYFSLSMAVTVIILNRFFIELFGINGAALATLIVVVLFGIFKLLYIKKKMQIQPFSKNTFRLVILIVILFMIFYFINIGLHPLLNIAIKSLLLTVIYVYAVYKLNVSIEYNAIFIKYFKRW
jgi:O-antigen/teichoic acid export membrane protein